MVDETLLCHTGEEHFSKNTYITSRSSTTVNFSPLVCPKDIHQDHSSSILEIRITFDNSLLFPRLSCTRNRTPEQPFGTNYTINPPTSFSRQSIKMPRHSSIFPGDTPNRHELERRLRVAEITLREESERCARLENLIEFRAQLISSYLEEEKERARDRADMLWDRHPLPGSDEWVDCHKAQAVKALIKSAIRALGPAMRSARE